MPFPLEQWFDVSKKISKDDLADSLDQMVLYAYKDGISDKDLRAEQREMKVAVRAHNKKFAQC